MADKTKTRYYRLKSAADRVMGKMRIRLLIGVLVLLTGVGLSNAQPPTNMTLYRDRDSLTLAIPSMGQPVSLRGLRFVFARPDGTEIHRTLLDYPSFVGLPFDNLPPPVCFRLVRQSVLNSPPLVCNNVSQPRQDLNDADVIWYDSVSNSFLNIVVYSGELPIVICPSGDWDGCPMYFVTPTLTLTNTAALTPTSTFTETATWTLTPTLLPTLTNTALPTNTVTDTPTGTFVPISTATRTSAPSATQYVTPIASVTSTLTPTELGMNGSIPVDVLELAQQGVTHNADWAPYFETINGVEMVLVPVGCFMMGSNALEADDDEQPVHEQCFDEVFWISRTEVTNTEYADFIDAGGYENRDYWTNVGWTWRMTYSVTQPSQWMDNSWNHPNHPVVGISWYEASAYASWKGMRLLTDAEWEYAARGVDEWEYAWGNIFDGALLNFCDVSCGEYYADILFNDYYEYTAPVGYYAAGASWVGAVDMSGNVWEWVSSIYQSYPYRRDDGREDIQAVNIRLLRGGSWYSEREAVRTSSRDSSISFARNVDVGFRIYWIGNLS